MKPLHTRGTPTNSLVAFLRHALGAEGMTRLRAGLSAEDVRYLSGEVLATERVPVEVLNRMTRQGAQIAGEPLFDFSRRAGRYAAELSTRTVYKFILNLLSPGSVIRACPSMWGRVFDGGKVSVEVKDGWGQIRLEDVAPDRSLCGRLTGWFEFIGDRAARDMQTVHRPCAALGGEACTWEFHWSP